MNTLIFATNNPDKVIEVRSLLKDSFAILSLKEAGIDIDIPEPFDTLEENAKEKSSVIFTLKKMDCFSEDTGLEVDALQGAPGVRSARYAGNERSFDANIDKLLFDLKNTTNRKAQFRTIVCLMINGKQTIFEGICTGRIINERCGTRGFGYDPVFIPDGAEKTFAEMHLTEKNIFSHRKKAIEKLVRFLKETMKIF